MADLPKLPGIPSISPVKDTTVAAILRPMKESLEILNSAISGNALPNGSVITTGFNPVITVTTGSTTGYDPATDYTPPPTPTGLTISAGFTNILLSWNDPNTSGLFLNYAYAEIWRSVDNVLGHAVLQGFTVAAVYADPVGTAKTYYYWIRFVSQANVAGPYNSSVGTIGGTGLVGGADLSPLIITADKIASGAIDLSGTKITGLLANANMAVISDPTKIADYLISSTKLADLAVEARSIQSGAVSLTKFASGIQPVTIVTGTLPTVKSTETIFFNTKLYRWDGTAYVATVPTTDLTGTVVDAQIAGLAASKVTGTLSDSQLAAISAAKVTGTLSDAQLAAISAAKITGTLSDTQIAAISATKVTGTLSDTQIAAVSAAKVTGQITSTQITDGAISTAKLAAGAVTAATIAADTITAGQIAAGAITASELAAGAVTAGKIAAGTITAGDIATGTITATQLAAGSVTAGKIAAGTIVAGDIATGTITATQLAAGAVTAGKIAAGTIQASDIAANAITAGQIAANTITASQIASDTITAGQIAAGAITASELAASAVTAGKIATNAIIAGDGVIGNAAITNALIANAAVGSAQIVDAAITSAKIGSLAVGNAAIQNAAITNAKIADLAVDNAKIASLAVSKLTAGSINVGEYIQSTGYSTGVTGWSIGGNGTAEFGAASIRGQLTASQIDTRNLTIKDSAGTVLFGAGTNLSYSNITASSSWLNSNITLNADGTISGAGGGAVSASGIGAVKTDLTNAPAGILNSNVTATSIGAVKTDLSNAPAGILNSNVSLGTLGAGAFAYLNSITSANVTTYISGAAIGTAQIGVLAAGNIGANTIDASKIAAGTIWTNNLKVGSSPAISGTAMTGTGAVINSDGTFALGNSATNITFDSSAMYLNGNVVATGNINTNAVTNLASITTVGSLIFTSGTDWDIQTLSFTSSGYPIRVDACFMPENRNGGYVIAVYRVTGGVEYLVYGGYWYDSTNRIDIRAGSGFANYSLMYSFFFVDTPSAGTHTYILRASSDTGGAFTSNHGARYRSLGLTEAKR